jgi:hypothetical protein
MTMMRRIAVTVAALLVCACVPQLVTAGVSKASTLRMHQASAPRPSRILFDGRASRIALSRATSATGLPTTEAGWDCLCFLSDGFAVRQDSRFGAVYSVTAGLGYHNPWLDLGPWRTSSELSKRRPVGLGRWDWYSNSIQLQPGFSATQEWGLVADMNYPTISHSPLEIDYDKYGVGISRTVGYIEKVLGPAPIYDMQRFWRPREYPALIGKWIDWVIGVRWATNTTGAVRVYTRCIQCRHAGWILRYSKSGIITMQWGGGLMNADGKDVGTGREFMTIDKIGLYYGYTQPQAFAMPTNHVLEMGMVRSSTRATAMSVFP